MASLQNGSMTSEGRGIDGLSADTDILEVTERDGEAEVEASPAFQLGLLKNGTTLVLAAPGLDEAAAGHPAAGRTGTNLDLILAQACVAAPESFPSADRRDYRIVNAVSLILHGDRTLPRVSEIEDAGNKARLRRQLAGPRTIAAFGPHAARAVRAIDLEPDFCTGHPGLKGLNQLPVPDGTPPAEATRIRLRLLGDALIESRGRCRETMKRLEDLRKVERLRRKRLKDGTV